MSEKVSRVRKWAPWLIGGFIVVLAVAAFVFSGLYFPLAFGDAPRSALVHFLLYLAEGVALLAPYYLLRPAMRPLNGMNGF